MKLMKKDDSDYGDDDDISSIVLVKLMSDAVKPDSTVEECVRCPMFKLTLVSGDTADADCKVRTGDYNTHPPHPPTLPSPPLPSPRPPVTDDVKI